MSGSPAFVRPADADWTPTEPGVRRRILTHDDKLMLVEVDFEPGAIGSLHSHPNIQASYVVKGSFEVTIDGRTETLSTGQSFIVASNLIHGVKALEASTLLDTFTPTRSEFL